MSQLASQLRKLQTRSTANERASVSFLFSNVDAKQLSREQVHELAVDGLQTLVVLDNRFHRSLATLFDTSRVRQERSMLSHVENNELNASIDGFLTLLSPHLFSSAAQQVFEYLVRVHEVHTYNVEAVLRAFLPYHDHSIFARAVMLLDLRDTGFAFLSTNQERGAALPLSQLIAACAESRKALRILCSTVAFASWKKVSNAPACALFASVASKLATNVNAEALFRELLPYLVAFITGSTSAKALRLPQSAAYARGESGPGGAEGQDDADHPHSNGRNDVAADGDLLSAALLVICAWSSEASLSPQTLAAVIQPLVLRLSRGTRNISVGDAVSVIGLLVRTQPSAMADVTFTPTLNALLDLPWEEWVALLPRNPYCIDALVVTLLRYCIARVQVAHARTSIPHNVLVFMSFAARELPLRDTTVDELLRGLLSHPTLLREATAPVPPSSLKAVNEAVEVADQGARAGSSGAESPLPALVTALERRFRPAFDASISRILSEQPEDQEVVMGFLAAFFSGARYDVMSVSTRGAGGEKRVERLPLFTCMLHPVAEIRIMALKRVGEMDTATLIGEGGENSLLSLVLHVTRFEEDAAVALQCLNTIAHHVHLLRKPVKGNGEVSTSQLTAPGSLRKQVAASEMQRAVWEMLGQFVAKADREFINLARQYFLSTLKPSLMSGAAAGKPKRKGSAVASVSAPSVASATALSYTVLLYQLLAAHGWGGKAECGSGKRITATPSHAPAAGDGVKDLTGELAAALTTLFPGLQMKLVNRYGDADGGAKGLKRSGVAQGSTVEALSVMEHLPLLRMLRGDLTSRQDDILEAAVKALRSDQGKCSALCLEECCLLAAAVAGCAVDSASGTDDIERLLAFFTGRNGYFAALEGLEREREQQRLQNEKEVTNVGRGAQATIRPSGCLPRDALTAAVGRVVLQVVAQQLRSGVGGGERVPTLVAAMTLTGLLGAPLPALGSAPTTMAAVLLHLLETPERSPHSVDWPQLVSDSVFAKPDGGAAVGSVEALSVGTLSITLLHPLVAPAVERQRMLQKVQRLILSPPSATATSGADAAVGWIQGTYSKTALSAVIERLATREGAAPITREAARLLCDMMSATCPGSSPSSTATLLMPHSFSARVIAEFFPVPPSSTGSMGSTGRVQATALGLSAELSRGMAQLVSNLVTGQPDTASHNARLSEGKDAAGQRCSLELSPGAAQLVGAVGRRLVLEESPADGANALDLCLAFLRVPYVRARLESGDVVSLPVYRYALTALALMLREDAESARSTSSVVFIAPSKTASGRAGRAQSSAAADYARRVVERSTPTLFRLCATVGLDIRLFLGRSTGGFTFYFQPRLKRMLSDVTTQPLGDLLEELELTATVLDVMRTCESTTSDVEAQWQIPHGCGVAVPLADGDIQGILRLVSGAAAVLNRLTVVRTDALKGAAVESAGAKWQLFVLLFQLCTALLRIAPSVCVARNAADDGEDEETSATTKSLYAFATEVLRTLPVSQLDGAFTAAAFDETAGTVPRYALEYLGSAVELCASSGSALNEAEPNGATKLRIAIIKDCLLLMATVLSTGGCEPATTAAGAPHPPTPGVGRPEEMPSRAHEVQTVSAMLACLVPIMKSGMKSISSTASPSLSAAASEGVGSTFLHIPIVALLIRLEAVELTGALQFRSALDICQEVLSSCDAHTQMACLSSMMRLVMNPLGHLGQDVTASGAGDDASWMLFRKLVKPNQVINRQEQILTLITSCLKADNFLVKFIEVQHLSSASSTGLAAESGARRAKGARGSGVSKRSANTEDAAEGGDAEAQLLAEEEGTDRNDECAALLVAALELFAHYHSLNAATANDAAGEGEGGAGGDATEDVPAYGEQKSYVMLLELLSGNALACVLAGINEPTFVGCQSRLLQDSRLALQRKGLETLLDRLHQSLPTVEFTVGKEEVEEQRRRLRDPRKKLTLMDLVRVKARPLTTKRTMSLAPALLQILSTSWSEAIATSSAGAHRRDVLELAQLALCCMEETLRIVASGGSTQAEQTLLNARRTNTVTEMSLTKLLGNKGRVDAAHHFMEFLLNMVESGLPWLVAVLDQRSRGESGSTQLVEAMLLTLSSSITAVGTLTQTLGAGFAARHSHRLLDTTTKAAVFAVSGVPGFLARGTSGSLLRRATLNSLIRCLPSCWLMCQPFLTRVIFAISHVANVDDSDTSALAEQLMGMLEALLDPTVLIDSFTNSMKGGGKSRPGDTAHLSVLSATAHSLPTVFGSVERLVGRLRRDDIRGIDVLVGGATASDNFWLASLHTVTSSPTLPSSTVLSALFAAYMAFFVKFKAKHCVKFMTVLVNWAFAEQAPEEAEAPHGGAVGPSLVCGSKRSKTGSHARAAEEEGGDGDGERRPSGFVPRRTVQRWIAFLSLLNYLLEKLEGVLDFSFSVVLPPIVRLLETYCSASRNDMKSVSDYVSLALEGALDSIRRMALIQCMGPDDDPGVPREVYFKTPEVFSALMPAIVRQLSNVVYLENDTHSYAYRAEHCVIPAVRAFFRALDVSKLQANTQSELSKALRHPSRHVRRMALVCLNGVYTDGGDELASRIMAEVLPAVVEATEDTDSGVVEAARQLCLNLSAITGQDVLHAMS